MHPLVGRIGAFQNKQKIVLCAFRHPKQQVGPAPAIPRFRVVLVNLLDYCCACALSQIQQIHNTHAGVDRIRHPQHHTPLPELRVRAKTIFNKRQLTP